MPIRTEDVKIKESQRLTDHNDGGGYMTAREVVDGNINNLFTDISRLDRAYGRVSLRKCYMHVDTDDTEMQSGAHVIISELAKDPNVRVALFATENDSDTRREAVNRLESYVTLGPRSLFWLWSDQPAGSRQLLMFCNPKVANPEAGDVLCLFNNKGTSSEYSQYVRVTKVKEHPEQIQSRKILTVTIGDPLERTFVGDEIHNEDARPTSVYTTMVSNAAKYYGVMLPAGDIKAGDFVVPVESIYTHLVPTSQAETPLVNLTPGDAGPVKKCGDQMTLTFDSQTWTSINLGQGFVPGTLELSVGTHSYTDDGTGVLAEGGVQRGTINHCTGRVFFAESVSGEVTARFDPGAAMQLVPNTLLILVLAAGRGYNYVAALWPPPDPGTVTVDYMAEGKWYRLGDNGAGILEPYIEGTGTGRIDYESGHVTITCAALPDVDLPILVRWGVATELIQLQGAVEIDIEPVHHTLSGVPVAPGSLSITWPVSVSDTATATDDGHGAITGDARGWVNYGSGELEFTPLRVPVSGSEYKFHHNRYAKKTYVGSGITFSLPDAPIQPGSLSIEVPMSTGGASHTYHLRDNGSGQMSAPGWRQVISQCRTSTKQSTQQTSNETTSIQTRRGKTSGEHSAGEEYKMNSTEDTTAVSVGPISASIDYVTGQVVFDLTQAGGQQSVIHAQANKSGQGNSVSKLDWK